MPRYLFQVSDDRRRAIALDDDDDYDEAYPLRVEAETWEEAIERAQDGRGVKRWGPIQHAAWLLSRS